MLVVGLSHLVVVGSAGAGWCWGLGFKWPGSNQRNFLVTNHDNAHWALTVASFEREKVLYFDAGRRLSRQSGKAHRQALLWLLRNEARKLGFDFGSGSIQERKRRCNKTTPIVALSCAPS